MTLTLKCFLIKRLEIFSILVPSKGPNITVLTVVSATSIKIRWGSLTIANSNGIITKFEVCYIASQNPGEINCNFRRIVEGNTTEVVLDELTEATVYNVAVKAATKVGLGPLGTIMTGKTLEDGWYISITITFRYYFALSFN